MSDELVRIAGTIRSTGDAPLSSPLGGVACVGWELRAGIDGKPESCEFQNFWLDTETGAVLVVGENVELDALATRKRQALSVVEADIADVSQRIKALKQQHRESGGRQPAGYQAERKRLAAIATLLCAMKAATRGRVHRGGTLQNQQKWIDRQLHLVSAAEGGGQRAGAFFRERWEVVIAEGQRVEVEGISREEAVPGVTSGDGYRSRPTTRTLRAAPGETLRVTGLGAIAPAPYVAPPPPSPRPKSGPVSAARDVRRYIAAAFVLALLIWLTWR